MFQARAYVLRQDLYSLARKVKTLLVNFFLILVTIFLLSVPQKNHVWTHYPEPQNKKALWDNPMFAKKQNNDLNPRKPPWANRDDDRLNTESQFLEMHS